MYGTDGIVRLQYLDGNFASRHYFNIPHAFTHILLLLLLSYQDVRLR